MQGTQYKYYLILSLLIIIAYMLMKTYGPRSIGNQSEIHLDDGSIIRLPVKYTENNIVSGEKGPAFYFKMVDNIGATYLFSKKIVRLGGNDVMVDNWFRDSVHPEDSKIRVSNNDDNAIDSVIYSITNENGLVALIKWRKRGYEILWDNVQIWLKKYHN